MFLNYVNDESSKKSNIERNKNKAQAAIIENAKIIIKLEGKIYVFHFQKSFGSRIR